jgi:hypothetical protein
LSTAAVFSPDSHDDLHCRAIAQQVPGGCSVQVEKQQARHLHSLSRRSRADNEVRSLVDDALAHRTMRGSLCQTTRDITGCEFVDVAYHSGE